MNRRESLLWLLAASGGVVPSTVHPQDSAGRGPLRIGFVPDFSQGSPMLKLLSGALSEFGRIEGRDYVYIRSGVTYGSDDRLALARVLDAKPDVILVMNLGYAVAARKQTTTIPVVMWISGFPVEGGVAESLARPGGNVTGMTIYASGEVFGKLVQLVHETRPGSRRIGALMSYVPPFHPRAEADLIIKAMHDAAGRLGIELVIHEIARTEQIDEALASLARHKVEALVLTSDSSMVPRLKEVFRIASEWRIPSIIDAPWYEFGDPQPLLTYHADFELLLRQSATYVNKILWEGAKPGDLPIQLPARFVLTINQKTAKAIGLSVPQAVLVRADRVVE